MQRVLGRKTFGKLLWEHGSLHRDIADSVQDLHAARLLTLDCASRLDEYDQTLQDGNKVGRDMIRSHIAMLKVAVPQLTFKVIDRALQVSHCESKQTHVAVKKKTCLTLCTMHISPW